MHYVMVKIWGWPCFTKIVCLYRQTIVSTLQKAKIRNTLTPPPKPSLPLSCEAALNRKHAQQAGATPPQPKATAPGAPSPKPKSI